MADRHWQQVSDLVGSEVNPSMEAALTGRAFASMRWKQGRISMACTLKT